MSNFFEKALKQRAQTNNLRSLKISAGVDFSSNDYLGFSQNKELQAKVEHTYNKLTDKQLGSGGSRLLTGNSELTLDLEKQIANFCETEAALVYNSGYVANTGLLSCIGSKADCFIYDKECHASIREGMQLSVSKTLGFKHNDLIDLEKKLNQGTGQKFVVIESVYSMSGDLAPLVEIKEICKRHQALLIVDEAHAIGVIGSKGKGLCEQEKVKPFAKIITFGKALGCHGAAVAGSMELIDFLTNFSKPFIYTTALPSHSLICMQEALNYLDSSNLHQRLWENINYFAVHMGIQMQSPIFPFKVSGNEATRKKAQALQDSGLVVFPILHPTVKKGEECLRISLHAHNTKKEMDKLVTHLKHEH